MDGLYSKGTDVQTHASYPRTERLRISMIKIKPKQSKSACGFKPENELIHLQYGGLSRSQGGAGESIK